MLSRTAAMTADQIAQNAAGGQAGLLAHVEAFLFENACIEPIEPGSGVYRFRDDSVKHGGRAGGIDV